MAHAGGSTQKLPRKWLEPSWVEHYSSVVQDDGTVVYNTDVIDRPDLCDWIRTHQYPQATTKNYRDALRRMCRSEVVPGYRKSELTPVLRDLLAQRIATLGRRMWSCQLVELRAEAAAASTVPRTVSHVRHYSAPMRVDDIRSNHSPIVPPMVPEVSCASSAPLTTYDLHESIVDSAVSLYSAAPSTIRHHLSSDGELQKQARMPRRRLNTHQSDGSIPSSIRVDSERQVHSHADIPLDDAILRDGLAEFGFGMERDTRVDKPNRHHHSHLNWRDEEEEVDQCREALNPIQAIIPQHMSIEHLAEFHKLTVLLRGQETSNVPPLYFKALEHHFTQCFSLPGILSVVIMDTDRFQTGRADPFANQQACKLFGVELTQVQHIIMGIAATRRVSEVLSQAARVHASTGHVSGIWINTRDQHGNPCPRLVDIWLPRVVFNGTNFVVIIAPHRTVTLDRPFETFRMQSFPVPY
jgi:hypothetical protein